MAGYNWIVICLAMGIFGLLYVATYDVMSTLHDSAYVGSVDAERTTDFIWLCWKYSPIAVIVIAFVYGYMSAQKPRKGF